MINYVWNGNCNCFVECDENANANSRIYSQIEVETLFASKKDNQVIKDVDGVPTLVEVAPLDEIEKQRRIAVLKKKLKETDYQAIKFAEGEIGISDFAPIKVQRASWRAEINELENN